MPRARNRQPENMHQVMRMQREHNEENEEAPVEAPLTATMAVMEKEPEPAVSVRTRRFRRRTK